MNRHSERQQQIYQRELVTLYKIMAENPPIEALPWSDLWREYEESLQKIEVQILNTGMSL